MQQSASYKLYVSACGFNVIGAKTFDWKHNFFLYKKFERIKFFVLIKNWNFL